MRDNVHVAFRVSKKLKREAAALVSKGVFQDESELFRAALRELILKYKVMAIENPGSS